MKANLLLKQNIRTLLAARKQEQTALARWVRPGVRDPDPWLSQILSKPDREFQTKYLDRIADFFGIAVYQLFQPGISRFTERRSGLERRSGRDRRIGKALQVDAPPSPTPLPEEWALISKFRRLTSEERVRLDHAADVLLLSQGVEAKTAPRGNTKATAPRAPAVAVPLRARRRSLGNRKAGSSGAGTSK